MADAKKSVFRPKVVESIQSPEVMDDYLRVTNPGVWVFLGAVVCLLVGVILWGVFGSIRSGVDTVVFCNYSTPICVVAYEDSQSVANAGEVIVGDQVYALDIANAQQAVLDDDTDPRILIEGGFSAGDYVVAFPLKNSSIQNGAYPGYVITETLKPMSLLFQ